MNKQKKQTGKKIAAVAAVIALLAGGTYAWTDFTQHKTNEFFGNGRTYDVSLNEEFKEKDNWMLGEDVQKIVNVSNKGRLNIDGSVFVRLQFKEFLEYVEGEPILSEHRYMIDTKGNFITADSQEKLEAYMTEHKIPLESIDGVTPRIEKNKGVRDSEELFYIVTQAKDDNGQYGRFLTVGYGKEDGTPADPTPLVPKEKNYSNAAKDQHHDKRNAEDGYTAINWLDKDSVYRKYINLVQEHPEEFILASEWDGKEVEKWIIDDVAETAKGEYLYWGTGLRTGETTKNALDKTKLVNVVPGQHFYYALHVDMEAISADEIAKQTGWQGISQNIIDMVNNYKEPTLIAPSEVGATFVADGYEWKIVDVDSQGRKLIILNDVLRDAKGNIVSGLANVANPTTGNTSVYNNAPGVQAMNSLLRKTTIMQEHMLETSPVFFDPRSNAKATTPVEAIATGKGQYFIPNAFDLKSVLGTDSVALNDEKIAEIAAAGFKKISVYSREYNGDDRMVIYTQKASTGVLEKETPILAFNDKSIMIRPMAWIKDDAR